MSRRRVIRLKPDQIPATPSGGIPFGPRFDDAAHIDGFSEVGPPETMTVADQRVTLFDHNGRPLTRRAGF